MWQKKYYEPLFALLAIGLPVLVPWYFWNESLWLSFWVNFNLRFCITLNIAFFVNSVAHMYGKRPYDKWVYEMKRFCSPIINWTKNNRFQNNKSGRKFVRCYSCAWWRMAQLSPCISMGLQNRWIGRLYLQYNNCIYWRFCQAGMGLRS